MTVLVTGGSGFVGLNLLQLLLERGDRVVNLSLAPPPAAAQQLFDSLPGTLQSVVGDACDAPTVERIFEGQGIERVVHAAVITAGPERERSDPAGIVAVNLQSVLTVLEAARRHGVQRFVYPSSGAVYGESAYAAPVLDEDATPPRPVTLYGISKYAAERMALRYRTLHGMDVLAARLGIVFGRWEHATGQRDTLSAIYELTRLARAGETAALPNAGRRDWVYAPDVAAGLVTLLYHPQPAHAVYHVTAGREWSAEQWCERLQTRYPDFRFRMVTDEAQANVNLYRASFRAPLSNLRLREETGFAARFGLDEAFADYLDWLERYPLDNRQG
ncbi:MAG TPA: NAD(P)-dependent oxidoreductase [bacterium]|nr:NAD(P)-dependent oxidoreductase [bacterium]